MLAVGTAAGLAILWPGDTKGRVQNSLAVDTQKAEVVEVNETTCPGLGEQRCQLVTARLTEWPGTGKRVQLQLSAVRGLDPDLDPGDDIRVTKGPAPPSGQAPIAGPAYGFYDFQRGRPMLVLALIFIAIVVLFGRLRGALSLAGLGLSLALVLVFVVPGDPGRQAAAGRCDRRLPGGGADHDPARPRPRAEDARRGAGNRGEPAAHGPARPDLHEGDAPDRLLERGGRLPRPRRRQHLAGGAAAGRDGDRGAGRARRRHRQPGLDRAGAARREPDPAVQAAVRRRAAGRPRPRERDREHARARLRRRRPADPAHLQLLATWRSGTR